MDEDFRTVPFELKRGLKQGDQVLKTGQLREPTRGDIRDATRRAKKHLGTDYQEQDASDFLLAALIHFDGYEFPGKDNEVRTLAAFRALGTLYLDDYLALAEAFDQIPVPTPTPAEPDSL